MIRVSEALRPTVGDLLFAGQGQRTRILTRTARGVDVEDTAFAPYSEKGPYYYYPGKNAKDRVAARNRFVRKVGGSVRALKKISPDRSFAHVHSGRANRSITGLTTLGIKFASYGAFKRTLGRFGVDLRGPSAPHMLQAIVVRVNEITLTQGVDGVFGRGEGNAQPADVVRIGIYGGDEAAKAEGHQTGAGHLPVRRFIGANEEDKSLMLSDIIDRMLFRVRRAMGGGR